MKSVTLIFVFGFTHLGTVSATGSYKAAVFEHYPLTSDTPEATILKNIEEYQRNADSASRQGANILVFPEYGLTGLVTDPEEYAIDLDGTTNKPLIDLELMAAYYQVYVVANILEKEKQDNKNTKYYNTNLVINPRGTIILKYRKINLYNEPNITPGSENQNVSFMTDFGVTFGIFTGNDILFENPSRRVLNDAKVTDIVYPTAWYSTMPFYTALTVQFGYNLATGVNLLAANFGKPKEGHGGSGIYSASGRIADIYISDSSSSKPLVQTLLKIIEREDKSYCLSLTPFGLPTDSLKSHVSGFKTTKNFRASEYSFKNVDLSKTSDSIEVCDNDFCCTFDIIVNQNQLSFSDHYKVMAFDGYVDYNGHDYRTRICSLLACETDSSDTCGARFNQINTRFTELKVTGNVKRESGTFYVPASLNSLLLPLKEVSYCNDDNATDSTYVEFQTTQAQDNVLVFGIVGKTNISAAHSSPCGDVTQSSAVTTYLLKDSRWGCVDLSLGSFLVMILYTV